MFKNVNIGSKITAVVLGVVLLTVLGISYVSFNFSKQTIRDRYMEKLSVIAQLKAEKVESFFEENRDDAQILQRALSSNAALQVDSLQSQVVKQLSEYKEVYGYRNLMVATPQGELIVSTSPEYTSGDYVRDVDGELFTKAQQGSYFSNVYRQEGDHLIYQGLPLKNAFDETFALLLIQYDMEPVWQALNDTTGLGQSGELLVGKVFNNKINYLNPLRHQEKGQLQKGVYVGQQDQAYALQQAVKGNTGANLDTDYRDKEVLAAWTHIPTPGWGLVAKVDTDELYADSNGLLSNFVIASLLIILLSFMIAFLFSRFLTSPIASLKGTMQLLGEGMLPDKVSHKSNDEIGQMAQTMDNFVQGLKRTAGFAHKIGEGKFDADFKPLSEKDTLGTALMSMRDSIQEAEKRDTERNWIVTGVAEIGEILREHDDLEQMGDAVIAYVTNKIDAIQGAFYVVNDDDKDDVFIEMQACYAYHKKKYHSASFRFAEGLVGQAAIEQDTLLRTEIPDDYVTITSGLLGDQKPSCILIVPLITNEQVYGVLEFAGFERFNSSQVKFVEEISLITARTVFNIKVNERTRRLLEESQKMSKELQMQQEVLRQNAEEMEATQEELQRTNKELEERIEEVNHTQKRTQLLLENASEVITIYEKDGKVRYISPSVTKILGYRQEDLIDKNDIEYVLPVHREAVENMFEQLQQEPDKSVTLQFEYKRKDGEYVWVEATGTNLLNDPAVKGIILNSRDITERRRAEQEQRMRSQMQALSENSPDLITRINTQGEVFYINPIIESYTGNKPDHFLNKSVEEVNLEGNIVSQWMDILNLVQESDDKVAREMDFPSDELGERVMQVNAIPEYNEEENMESVLLVSHDITERKLIELEIQSKNKKITESINYAKRIQGAILPDTQVINQVLPESFIMYKAKDVVSGDFPWYLKVGDDIFIAAVDCTGHGVPGALISLIGYFLLNDIVKSRKITDPGVILDLLDEGVTQTLRQGKNGSKAKDGMDIALCKINQKKNEVEYAGAHRPLYFMKEGELEEIKGNKFPIGGGRFKNQTNFTSHKVKVKKGDSIFFCSDGYPDQFGGPENRKFGPKRLRNLIREHHQDPIGEMAQTFDQSWEEWKGEYKQTDDVLLIGIRF